MAESDTRLSRIAADADAIEEAMPINDHVYVSKDMGDCVLVTGARANVVVNAGFPHTGARHKARFERISSNPLAYLVLTQCHLNQFGGTYALKEPETKVIAHARFQECRGVWISLAQFYKRRSNRLWGGMLGERSRQDAAIREVVPDVTFEHSHSFDAGGRRFELFSTPGGESLDAIVVWLAQDRLAITGNLFGPIFGEFPNLYTIRGDRVRSATRFIESLELVRNLRPETIITGHEVITGWRTIDATLTRLRDAVRYVHDRTIEGMNAGRDVHDLMRKIALPEDLQVGQGHGKVSWSVRAVWEEYAGWFHYDSTTSLYPAPRASVAADLVELAGGTGPVVARAKHHLGLGEPLRCLHLVELVLAFDPNDRPALEVKLRAHSLLLERSGGENFSEVRWLETEMEATREALAASDSDS